MWTVKEAYHQAMVVEQQRRRPIPKSDSFPWSNQAPENQGDMQHTTVSTPPIYRVIDLRSSKQALAGTSTLWCYNYGEIEHTWSECKKSAGQSGKHLLIEEEELSDEDQESTYDKGGEEEDDSLLFGDREETPVV